MRRRSRALPLALIALMSLAVAACGTAAGSEGSDGVASLDGSAAGVTTTVNENEAPSDPEEAFALFEECMADHGVDDLMRGTVRFGDGGGIDIPRGDADSLSPGDSSGSAQVPEVDPEVFETARQECDHHLENVDDGFELTPEQEAAFEDARLEFQECMVEHGIEGDFMFGAGGGPGFAVERDEEVDPQSTVEIDPEKLEAANEACMEILTEIPELEGVFNGPGE